MKLASSSIGLLLLTLSHTPASAQQLIFDQEPNASKPEATQAFDLVDGDILIAEGYGGCGAGPPDVDYFRLRTAPLPLGIYRHDLVDVGGFGGTEMYLVGLDAIQETVIPGSYDYLQTVPIDGTGTKFLSWYGFGKSEEVYANLFTEYSCRTSIETTLRTTPVQAVDLGVVNSSPTFNGIGIRTDTPNDVRDLELHLFDSEFNAVPRMNLDRIQTGPVAFTAKVGPGVYYAAVADHNLATHLPHYIDADVSESRTLAGALDFAGAAACGSPETGFDVLFTAGTVSATATKSAPFEILWFRFEVGVGQRSVSFCSGDGATISCPLGNDAPGNSGMGCVNSTGRGATLISRTTGYFTLEDLPPLSTALMFAGPQSITATPAASGLYCIGPGSIRVGPTSASFAGTAVLDPGSAGMSNLGMAGMTIYAQAVYRDTGSTVNLTNALQIVL